MEESENVILFFSSCKTTAQFKEASKSAREYVKQKFGIGPIGCCRPNHTKLTSEDTALVVCNNCAAIIEENTQVDIQFLWQAIDYDLDFQEADYFGVVSGNAEKDKFAKSGMTYTKSDLVDAPIINEFPIAMECEFIEYQSDDTGLGVIGKVLRTSVEEASMKDGKVDIDSLEAISFDPYTHGYYKVSGRVGEAFNDGLKLK